MKKCRYCGKELNSNFEFCSNECENSYRKIIEKDRQKIKYFMIGIILGFLVMFYGITLNSDFIIGIGIIVMGIDVVVLPFTTPETTTFLGYRKSKVVGRILGILLIAVGMSVIAILLLIMGVFENILPAFFVYIALGIILADVVIIIVLGNTICRR